MKRYNLTLFKFEDDKIIGDNWEINLDGEIVLAGDDIYAKDDSFWINIEYKSQNGWYEIGNSEFVDSILDYLVKTSFEINNKFVVETLNKKIENFIKTIDN